MSISLLLIVLSMLLFGQSKRLNFDHISIGDGLSQATVSDVIKDHQGLIWISTSEGLNRYDGYHFKVYRTTEETTSLSSNYIYKLYVDRHNTLWVCTADGLNRYDRQQDQFKRYYGESSTAYSSRVSFSDITEAEDGTLWAATRNSERYLLRYDEKSDQFIPHLHKDLREPLNNIVAFDEQHLLLAFGSKSLYLFNTSTFEFSKLSQRPALQTLKLVRGQNNIIWMGTDEGGLYAFYGKEQELVSFTHHPEQESSISSNVIWDIEIRPDGNLWLATDKGLNLFNTQTFTAQAYKYNSNNPKSISSNFLISVYEEPDGRIWLGSAESGISIVHPSRKAFEHVHNQLGVGYSLSNNAVWSVEEDTDGFIWVGTSEGLNRLDVADYSVLRLFNEPTDSKSLSHNRVWTIKADPFADALWLGTSYGLNKMTLGPDGNYEFTSWQADNASSNSLSSNSIRCLVVEETGVWVGTTSDGLNYFDNRTQTVVRYQYQENDTTTLSSDRVRAIYRDSQNRLWVGTSNGLNLMEGDHFKRIYHQPNDYNTLSNNHVRVIREGPENTFWIGTDYGLNKMQYLEDGSLQYTHYTVADGLPNNRVYAIEFEGDQLWVSTNNGISKFVPEAERFINFYDVDGLQSNEFNQGASMLDKQGNIYFGGINGLTRFSPQNVAAQDVRQDIVFTNFRIHFEDVSISEEGPLRANIITSPDIALDYDERVFSIEFNALNFNKQVKNRYAYRLWPFEQNWNFADQLNQAVYTNVPPGKYRFEVKTSTYGESSPDEINHLNIHVKHAYWETWWFRIMTILLALGFIYAFYQYRLRSLLRHQENLEKKVKERTLIIASQKASLEETLCQLKSTQNQLIEQEKMATIGQFTAGIAHEINNPINYISNCTDALAMDIQDLQRIFQAILSLNALDAQEKVAEIIQLRDEVDIAYLNEEINKLINSIKKGTQRTSDIIRSLRYLSYKDKPKMELFNIHDPIDSAVSILHSEYKDRIKLSKNYASLPEIMGFPGELNQVFVNMISNSIQAISGNGEITLSTQAEGADNVKITIADNGQGMSEGVLRRIFEPFYTTKEVGDGTGLGLSISYGIVESHGGKIAVNSTVGKGTRFEITLPIRPEEPIEE
ncbi:MAG: two-component regulator propeller domain-containing protein [Bacteroidota bacterium]